MIDPELQQLLTQQSERLQAVETQLAKIQKHMMWANVWSWARIVLLIIPLILGYVVLAPLLQKTLGQYQELLSSPSQNTNFTE